jgi:alpha-glucosidase
MPTAESSRAWWRAAVVYQIYPRSFCDTTGDGVGDLDGVRRHLDHLAWLGVDALWLSPIFRSPMADHGYDVSDYCDVDPVFGSLATVDALVAEAHARDLRVLLDWVPNHTSDRHPWFLASRVAPAGSPERDWYIWHVGTPDTPPTDWKAAFPPGPAWTWDDVAGAWYHHGFTPHQPDLNWNNPAVRAAMHDTLRFWLDRGVDGFRMDVIHMIGKDPARFTPAFDSPIDAERTHALLREVRAVLDAYPGERVSVGEVYILDVHDVATYVGAPPGAPAVELDPDAEAAELATGEELHLAFNFLPLYLPWKAEEWRQHLATVAEAYDRRRAWPTWVLSSHDIPRHRTRLGSEEAARAAAVLLLGLRGTPFLYAGEELGLEDAVVPAEKVVDPAGFRDGCRAPLPWRPGPGHGWASDEPWLPWPPDPDTRNVAVLAADDGSILHLYRQLLALRRATPALQRGTQQLLPPAPDVVAWRRGHDAGDAVVAVNFAAEPRPFAPPPGAWQVALASDARGGGPFGGTLAPSQAVVLLPG